MSQLVEYDANLLGDFLHFLESSRPRGVRDIDVWAREELRIPNGPYAGLRFDPGVQPFAGLWLRLLMERRWRRRLFTGPQQCGKTFIALGVPLMYALFELRETSICGVPDLNMVKDKWREDLLPMIEASNYEDQLPTRGSGARGGEVSDAVRFRNGVTLRFMTGGGGDKSRAGFTSRILLVTEVDGFDRPGETSKEADKLSQLEGRLRAYGEAVGVLPEETLECTVTDEHGRTWYEYTEGTESRLAMPCEHCEQFVTLGRGDLVGWQDARSVLQAGELSRFVCNACKMPWTDEGRRKAAQASVVVHAGQTVNHLGEVVGEAKETDTLSFRVSGVDNLFKSAGDLGVEEWRAARNPDEESAERAMCQWVWAIPTKSKKQDETVLTKDSIMHRHFGDERGKCPNKTIALGVGVDLGRHTAHYVVDALGDDDSGFIVDYNEFEVSGAAMGDEAAVRKAVDEAVDMFKDGYPRADGTMQPLGALVIDAGWQTDAVRDTCWKWRRKGVPVYAALGFSDRAGGRRYQAPKTKRKNRRYTLIGNRFHEEVAGRLHSPTLQVDVDHWKTQVIQSLSVEVGLPGARVLFGVSVARHHARFANHVLAEKKVEEFKPGKQGRVVYWEKVRDQNHYLDSLMLSAVASSIQQSK